MTERCEPPAGTAEDTLHRLSFDDQENLAIWRGELWYTANISTGISPEVAARWGWRYVGPLDLSAERMTPDVTALVDAATAWRDWTYRKGRGAANPITPEESLLLSAIEFVRPYAPPDPVAEALARLREAYAGRRYPTSWVGLTGLYGAVTDYLAVLDAKDRADAK